MSEGSDLVITITADNGKLLRSVTASVGTVVIAANKESATVTLSNVQADTSINITATASAKGSFAASISDSRVSGTGASSGIAEGSFWSSVLSLNGTAEQGATITAVSAEMEGGGEIAVNGNTISTDYVTGNITITVNVIVAGRVTITFPAKSSGVIITDNNDNDAVINDGVTSKSIDEGDPINWKLSPAAWHDLDAASYTMNGNTVQLVKSGDNFNLNVQNVSNALAINAQALNQNIWFKNVKFVNQTYKYLCTGWETPINSILSPWIDLGTRSAQTTIKLYVPNGGVIYFNNSFGYVDYYGGVANGEERTLNLPTTVRYVRFYINSIDVENLESVNDGYCYLGSTQIYDGSEITAEMIGSMGGRDEFLSNKFTVDHRDENGALLNWHFCVAGTAGDTYSNEVKGAAERWLCHRLNGTPTTPMGIGPTFQLPEKDSYRQFKFAFGRQGDGTTAPHIALIRANLTKSYYNQTTFPRTITSLSTEYVYGIPVFRVDDYNDTTKKMWLRDINDNNIWVVRDPE